MMPIPGHFIQIDEEGYPLSQEMRLQDAQAGQEILNNLQLHAGGTLLSTFGRKPVIVEAFDEPYIAQQVYKKNGKWFLLLPFEVEKSFQLSSLSLDEWDRFHGYADNSIPFVLSRKAQAMFFESLEEFDDETITDEGQHYEIPAYWSDQPHLNQEHFWSDIYRGTENPGWNLKEPAKALEDMLPRLKLTKSRVLVLGCGEGHDAARFAQDGHVVTAVDISPEAIKRAKALYGHLNNLNFVEADIFKLPASFDRSFDVVFEHTCYCAVNPQRRNELVKTWSRLLTEQGSLMGIFFTFEKRQGPPYGGSEWELRQRLKKQYQPLFWGRWQNSTANRQGKELFVFMRKLSHAH